MYGARRTVFLVAVAWLAWGCGLGMDLGPGDQPPGAGLDGSAPFDASGRDASTPDADAECGSNADCDDLDPCTGDETCVEGRCVPGAPLACPDDDPCDGVDRCAPGVGCLTDPPPSCDDGVSCTLDECIPVEGCRNTPDDAVCDVAPGGTCDAVTDCQYPECIEGVTCVAGPCQVAACSGTACARGSVCASDEMCCADACVPAGCDDGDPCTSSVCGPSGCESSPLTGVLCDDGNACTSGDRCASGSCAPGVLIACDDANPCTSDRCDPTTGCVHDPDPAGTVCGTNAVCSGPACVCVGGYTDCDGDGSCECPAGASCFASACTVTACRSDAECPIPGTACCTLMGSSAYNRCFDTRCLSCCMGF